MTIAEAKARLRIPDVWRTLDLPGEPGSSCKSPFREDRRASFSVSKDGLLFNDFTTGTGGDAIDFLQLATGLSRAEACRKFMELAGNDPLPPPIVKPVSRPIQETKKPNFPSLFIGTSKQLKRLANLRKISIEACVLANDSGLLRFANWRGFESWIVTDDDRLNAQARRMDGEPWEHINAKAQTLPGSRANWPLGTGIAEGYSIVMLVEGGPDLLAALHFITEHGAECRCTAIALLGASQRIHANALSLLGGKRIRIYAHADGPGRAGAKQWKAQLETVNCHVDAVDFSELRKADGTPIKDLNDCTQIHPDNAGELEGLLP